MPKTLAAAASSVIDEANQRASSDKGKGKGRTSLGCRIDNAETRMPFFLFQAFSSMRNEIMRNNLTSDDKEMASCFRALIRQFPGKVAAPAKDKPVQQAKKQLEDVNIIEYAKRILPGVASRTVFIKDDQKATRPQKEKDLEWNAEATHYVGSEKVANQIRQLAKNVVHKFKEIKPPQVMWGRVQPKVKAVLEELITESPLLALVNKKHLRYAISLSLIFEDRTTEQGRGFWSIVNEAADRMCNLTHAVLDYDLAPVPESLRGTQAGLTPVWPIGDPHISSPHVLMVLSPKKFYKVVEKSKRLLALLKNTSLENEFLEADSTADNAESRLTAIADFEKKRVEMVPYSNMPDAFAMHSMPAADSSAADKK